MPMAVVNAGSERATSESLPLDLPVCFRLSSRPTEQSVHDQETDVPDLPGVWAGVSVFMGADALRSIKRCGSICAAERQEARESHGSLTLSRRIRNPILHVSYLAQTCPFTPVILDLPE